MSKAKAVLPLVMKIIEKIDCLFAEYVGPMGDIISEEIFEDWVEGGRVGPTSVFLYITMLAEEIPEFEDKKKFRLKASDLVRIN